MKILVTGGAGFIGSHIVDLYLSKGHEVLVVDDLSTGREENLNPKAKFHKMDIRKQETAQVIKKFKPQVINHQAAQIDLRLSVEKPILDAKINILGSLNIFEAAVRSGSCKKVIFASTGGAIYGEADKVPTPENYPAMPVSPYGIAKLSVEHYLNFYKETYNLSYVSLRYANVYGPRQNPEGEAGVVAIFCQKMIAGDRPVINGDGEQTRDFVYVKDVAQANIDVLGGEIEGIYNIGTAQETEVNSIFEKLANILNPKIEKVYGPQKKGEQRRSALDASKAKMDFDWEAKIKLDKGLQETAEYFLENQK